MLTPNLLSYLIEAPSMTQALKTLRYAEDSGFPTDRERLPALITAMIAQEQREFAGAPVFLGQDTADWRSGGAA